ncbi:MAG TPA: hypothetical protein VFE60_15675 [Roseiarcus sp.]|nr:hypothetical protein [Roseiarcus sp.]
MTRLNRLLEPVDLGAQLERCAGELGRRQVVDVLPYLVGEAWFGLRPKDGLVVECSHALSPVSVVRRRR